MLFFVATRTDAITASHIIDNSGFAFCGHLFDEREKVSSGTELKDEPHVVPRLVPVVELQDVGAAKTVDHLAMEDKVKQLASRFRV